MLFMTGKHRTQVPTREDLEPLTGQEETYRKPSPVHRHTDHLFTQPGPQLPENQECPQRSGELLLSLLSEPRLRNCGQKDKRRIEASMQVQDTQTIPYGDGEEASVGEKAANVVTQSRGQSTQTSLNPSRSQAQSRASCLNDCCLGKWLSQYIWGLERTWGC